VTLAGSAFGLRPIRLDDAEQIVDLRSDPEKSRFVHAISPHVSDQIAWLKKYADRDGDYYFVVERLWDQRFEGTAAIYDVGDGRAEWGRWFLRPGSLAATESALLIYQAAFDVLGLTELYCRTVAGNKAVLSFHDRCGLLQHGLLKNAFNLANGAVDAIEHRLTANNWPGVRAHLSEQAEQVTRLINRRQHGVVGR